MADAFHEDFSVEAAPPRGSDRSFGLVLGVVGAGLALVPLLRDESPRVTLLAGSAVLAAIALVVPRALAYPHRLWLRLGDLLRALTTPIALGLIFYLVLTPIGLLARVLSHRRIPLRPDPGARSYWSTREPEDPPRVAMRRPF